MSDFKPDIESARFEIMRLERENQQLKDRIAELENAICVAEGLLPEGSYAFYLQRVGELNND